MKTSMETKINVLEEMKLPDLQTHFAEIVGEETKAPNKKYLIKRIVEALEQQDKTDASPANPIHTPETDATNKTQEETESTLTSHETINDSGLPESSNAQSINPVTETPEAQSNPNVNTNQSHTNKTNSLSEQDTETLRERYNEIVGRPTNSRDKRYLIWKIRQAQQGKITTGPLLGRQSNGENKNYKVLPFRMETELVEKLDEAWKRQGLNSRMDLFRQALSCYLADKGESELVELLQR